MNRDRDVWKKANHEFPGPHARSEPSTKFSDLPMPNVPSFTKVLNFKFWSNLSMQNQIKKFTQVILKSVWISLNHQPSHRDTKIYLPNYHQQSSQFCGGILAVLHKILPLTTFLTETITITYWGNREPV